MGRTHHSAFFQPDPSALRNLMVIHVIPNENPFNPTTIAYDVSIDHPTRVKRPLVSRSGLFGGYPTAYLTASGELNGQNVLARGSPITMCESEAHPPVISQWMTLEGFSQL